MITRLHSASVVVTDQDASLDFYVGTLGWEKRIDQPMGETRFITVAPPGSNAELSLMDPRMVGEADQDSLKPGMNLGISLVCKDMKATCAEMMAKGVTFPMPPADMPWGALGAHFQDPDGNTFFLTEDVAF
jgi:predicted enzyme related to lactoylglutathione lyase